MERQLWVALISVRNPRSILVNTSIAIDFKGAKIASSCAFIFVLKNGILCYLPLFLKWVKTHVKIKLLNLKIYIIITAFSILFSIILFYLLLWWPQGTEQMFSLSCPQWLKLLHHWKMATVPVFLVTFSLIIPHMLIKDDFRNIYIWHQNHHLQITQANSRREMER